MKMSTVEDFLILAQHKLISWSPLNQITMVRFVGFCEKLFLGSLKSFLKVFFFESCDIIHEYFVIDFFVLMATCLR